MVTQLQVGTVYDVRYEGDNGSGIDPGPESMLPVFEIFSHVYDYDLADGTFVLEVKNPPDESEKSFIDSLQEAGVITFTEKDW